MWSSTESGGTFHNIMFLRSRVVTRPKNCFAMTCFESRGQSRVVLAGGTPKLRRFEAAIAAVLVVVILLPQPGEKPVVVRPLGTSTLLHRVL